LLISLGIQNGVDMSPLPLYRVIYRIAANLANGFEAMVFPWQTGTSMIICHHPHEIPDIESKLFSHKMTRINNHHGAN